MTLSYISSQNIHIAVHSFVKKWNRYVDHNTFTSPIFYRKDNETKQVTFTITSVKEVDLKHTFVCRLFTAQTFGRMVTRMVKIHKRGILHVMFTEIIFAIVVFLNVL
jgi:hypothetical protein